MTINYSDGRAAEVVLLARTESTLLVALKGGDDVMEISVVDFVEGAAHARTEIGKRTAPFRI